MSEVVHHVCMLAAENGAIPGGKVGGIGDVIREMPDAIARTGVDVSVIVPAYGLFHAMPGSEYRGAVQVSFMGRSESVAVYEIKLDRAERVHDYCLHHPEFARCGEGAIYCNDGDDQPFASDATKFALFALAALAAIRDGLIGEIDVIHAHDWHAALALLLKQHAPEFGALAEIGTVFSIHNLALQGIRPLSGHESSLGSWYPGLFVPHATVADPRWDNCINPMATAIRLADVVHTVSPTYAEEIIRPNDPAAGFHGGEGLERDLAQAASEHRLVGILNGIDYSEAAAQRQSWPAFCRLIEQRVLRAIGRASDEQVRTVDYLTHQRIIGWIRTAAETPKHLLTSVGRLTDQKLALLLHRLDDERSVLEAVLDRIGPQGRMVLLGSGDPMLERRCRQLAAERAELLFLNLYDETIADALYAQGDLFLMPSAFEPCGISQMLAMRAGQPVLAHAVGGLCDTVSHEQDGFVFSGGSRAEQAAALLEQLDHAIRLREHDDPRWQSMLLAARKKRFSWDDSARRYVDELYVQASVRDQ